MVVFANIFSENQILLSLFFSCYLFFSLIISLSFLSTDLIFILDFEFSLKGFPQIADINSRKLSDTVEIYIQGGINGANGIQNNFKVYPVQMVVRMSKLKKDHTGSGRQDSRHPRNTFSDILFEKTVEMDQPDDCYTVTYDKNSCLRTFHYCQSREYTF